MYLIDTHTHIYLPEFDEDREAMLLRAQTAGVGLMVMPAIDSATHEAMFSLEEQHKDCVAMMGLHPCSVTDRYPEQIDIIQSYLKHRNFIAIGEIGLDFYWDRTFEREQYQAFEQQAELALHHGLPIVIHSRNATDECIEVVSRYPGLTGVFHCFSGNEAQARAIIDRGFMLGIGGVVTFKNSGLDKAIGGLGLDHLVLETDAPYLAPVPFRGKRNEPAYVKLVAEKLSQLYELPLDEVISRTTENAKRLFGLSD